MSWEFEDPCCPLKWFFTSLVYNMLMRNLIFNKEQVFMSSLLKCSFLKF